jgi:hypothetical protein
MLRDYENRGQTPVFVVLANTDSLPAHVRSSAAFSVARGRGTFGEPVRSLRRARNACGVGGIIAIHV